MCIGFLPVFSMALHNWVFGHVFVLFSANSHDTNLLVMPPSAYAAALREPVHAEFQPADICMRAFLQIVNWLQRARRVRIASCR